MKILQFVLPTVLLHLVSIESIVYCVEIPSESACDRSFIEKLCKGIGNNFLEQLGCGERKQIGL